MYNPQLAHLPQQVIFGDTRPKHVCDCVPEAGFRDRDK